MNLFSKTKHETNNSNLDFVSNSKPKKKTKKKILKILNKNNELKTTTKTKNLGKIKSQT